MTEKWDPIEAERLVHKWVYDEETTHRAVQILHEACSSDIRERRSGDLQLVAHILRDAIATRRAMAAQLEAAKAKIDRLQKPGAAAGAKSRDRQAGQVPPEALMNPPTPPLQTIELALAVAARSPCRSKRGVVIYDRSTGDCLGTGFNGPPSGECPGRTVCAGNCGQRSVHAEMRAIRDVERRQQPLISLDLNLIHVELAAGGNVTACKGPRCWQCASVILDVGFVSSVWLYEKTWETCDDPNGCSYCARESCRECEIAAAGANPRDVCASGHDRHYGLLLADPRWRRYSAADFYRGTLERCGMVP